MYLSVAGRAAGFALPALMWLLLVPGCTAQQPQEARPGVAMRAQVKYVVDGDTLILVGGQHVRLIGINAPELGKDGAPDEPLARAARSALEHLVGSGRITLVPGQETRDHYGRLLAHVQLDDGRSAQELLLGTGVAVAIAIPPNLGYHSAYQSAERQARDHGLGIWAEPYYHPLAVEQLRPEHRGFRLVVGRVQKVWRSRRYTHIEIGSHLDVLVPLRDLRFFSTAPEALLGKRVVVRGWLTSHGESLRMRVHHPAMLSMIN